MTLTRRGALLVGLLLFGGNPARVTTAQQPAAPSSTLQDRLNRVRADLFARAEHVPDDVRELKEILALDPRSAEGHLLLGVAYRTMGSEALMGEAVAELRQALDLNPAMAPARYFLAHIYLDLGRPGRAREELVTALAATPGNPQFLALLGETERQLKNPKRAVEVTRQALQADESFSQARYYLGLALFDLGQRDEAIKEFERVIRSGPSPPEAYLSLGTAYLEASRVDEAIRALVKGTEIDPARADLRIQLARAYRTKGLLDKAEAELRLAAPKKNTALAGSYYQHQQVEFDLALEQGVIKLQRGQLVAAAAALERALAMDAGHGPANRYIAEVYLRQGLYAKAAGHAALAEKAGSPLPEDKRKLLEDGLRRARTGGRD